MTSQDTDALDREAPTASRTTQPTWFGSIIDVDSHLTEPLDLWTSRMPSRWKDLAPRVEKVPSTGILHWKIGGRWLNCVGFWSQAGWSEFYPSTPEHWEDVQKGAWDSGARLAKLDQFGIRAQVLYPNLLAFNTLDFLASGLEFATQCVRAYNDFQTEWCSEAPDRLIPITMLPFWDVDASCSEIERAHAMGHRGVLFAAKMDRIGFPALTDPHWHPIFARAQALNLPINFHIGFSSSTQEEIEQRLDRSTRPLEEYVLLSSLGLLSNAETISRLILSGICDEFPQLRFVSVESGYGYIPYLLDALDWQWLNSGGHKTYPKRLLPSEYFRRQIYGSFWFESVLGRIESLQDNIMFETDYPHATSLTPGPASISPEPADRIQQTLAQLPEDTLEKLLFGNAERVYGLGASVQPRS
jgi:predicted TIM-barrel fold metal-dependent hydrolase